MSDFVLKKRKDFVFSMEEDETTRYVMPPLKACDLEDAKFIVKINDEKDFVKQGHMMREFVQKYVPELNEKGLSDMEYVEIFNAWALNNDDLKMGES